MSKENISRSVYAVLGLVLMGIGVHTLFNVESTGQFVGAVETFFGIAGILFAGMASDESVMM